LTHNFLLKDGLQPGFMRDEERDRLCERDRCAALCRLCPIGAMYVEPFIPHSDKVHHIGKKITNEIPLLTVPFSP